MWEQFRRIIKSDRHDIVAAHSTTKRDAASAGPQTVMQTNPDKVNCRQGNILDGVWGQVRFTALSS